MAVISYKCPHCDGELIFDPATQNYKCEYCDSSFNQAELDAMQPAKQEENGEGVYYSCPSCGAQIVTDATTAATFCYYCHNPIVLGGRLQGDFLPNKVIPFEIDKKTAEEKFLEFVGKKKFVPKAFFNKKQIESITGVYFPYWVYDAQFDGTMDAEARTVRVWRSGNTEYTETKHYHIERAGEVSLSNLTENALQKANAKLSKWVMPYDFSRMKEFNMGYLSGFLAEKRDIEQENVQQTMQQEMKESAEKLMRDTIDGYGSVSVRSSNFIPKKEDWIYALFPVWTVTYKGKNGNIYYYSMNGQTGKVCGELPIDYSKLGIVSAISGVAMLLLGLIGGFLL